jgi:predicted O-methyltransferase YrrM
MKITNDDTKIQLKERLTQHLLEVYYYASRLVLFVFITIKVFLYGILHPKVIFNFLFGVVTEIAEFHKRCGGRVGNFKETKLYRHIVESNCFPQSNVFNAGFGNIRPGEAQVLATLVAYLRPKTFFEIGTYDGFSTLHLQKNAPADAVIYTLDLPQDKTDIILKNDLIEAHRDIKNINLNTHRRFQANSGIVELLGDSMNFDYSPYGGKVDFIFVDANHSYAYVKQDTENAFRMLSPRGVILWHDYDFIHPGVFKLINEIAKKKKIFYIERTRYALFINDGTLL